MTLPTLTVNNIRGIKLHYKIRNIDYKWDLVYSKRNTVI